MIVERFRPSAVIVAGVAVMAAASAWNMFHVDENVPNDANIGAGLVFMAGIAVVIVGLALAWSGRSDQAAPPAPNQQ